MAADYAPHIQTNPLTLLGQANCSVNSDVDSAKILRHVAILPIFNALLVHLVHLRCIALM